MKGIRPVIAVEDVIPLATVQHVGVVTPVERVISSFAIEGVLSGVAVQGIFVEPAVKTVRPVAPVQRVIAVVPQKQIVIVITIEDIISIATVEGILAVSAMENILVVPPVEDVVAELAEQLVVAGVTIQGIGGGIVTGSGAGVSIDLVVPGSTVEVVGPVVAIEGVVAVPSEDGIHATLAVQDVTTVVSMNFIPRVVVQHQESCRVPVDDIVAGTATEHIRARLAINEIVVGPAIDGVQTSARGKSDGEGRIGAGNESGVTDNHVVSAISIQCVVTRSHRTAARIIVTVNVVGSVATVDRVMARSAHESVRAGASVQDVITSLPAEHVISTVPVKGVVAFPSVEEVDGIVIGIETGAIGAGSSGTVVSVKDVVSVIAVEGIRAGIANERIVGIPAVDDVIPGSADENVHSEVAGDDVVAVVTVEVVHPESIAVAIEQDVVPVASAHLVAAVATDQIIIAVVAVDLVIPVAALDIIIPIAADEHVIAVAALESVSFGRTGERVVTIVAFHVGGTGSGGQFVVSGPSGEMGLGEHVRHEGDGIIAAAGIGDDFPDTGKLLGRAIEGNLDRLVAGRAANVADKEDFIGLGGKDVAIGCCIPDKQDQVAVVGDTAEDGIGHRVIAAQVEIEQGDGGEGEAFADEPDPALDEELGRERAFHVEDAEREILGEFITADFPVVVVVIQVQSDFRDDAAARADLRDDDVDPGGGVDTGAEHDFRPIEAIRAEVIDKESGQNVGGISGLGEAPDALGVVTEGQIDIHAEGPLQFHRDGRNRRENREFVIDSEVEGEGREIEPEQIDVFAEKQIGGGERVLENRNRENGCGGGASAADTFRVAEEIAQGGAGIGNRRGNVIEEGELPGIEVGQREAGQFRVFGGQINVTQAHVKIALAIDLEGGNHIGDLEGDVGDIDDGLDETGVVVVDGRDFQQGHLAVIVVVVDVTQELDVGENRHRRGQDVHDGLEGRDDLIDALEDRAEEIAKEAAQFDAHVAEEHVGHGAAESGRGREGPIDDNVGGQRREHGRGARRRVDGQGGLQLEMGGGDVAVTVHAPFGIDDVAEGTGIGPDDFREHETVVAPHRARIENIHRQTGGEEGVDILDGKGEKAERAFKFRIGTEVGMHPDAQFRILVGFEEEPLGEGESEQQVEFPGDFQAGLGIQIEP